MFSFTATLKTWHRLYTGFAIPDELCKFKGRLVHGCKLGDLSLNTLIFSIKILMLVPEQCARKMRHIFHRAYGESNSRRFCCWN